MDLVINELSFHPLSESSQILEEKIRVFLKVFNEAKDRYEFTHICFPQNYSSVQVTTTLNFSEWITSLNNSTIKNAVLSLCRRPFIDDLNNIELSVFYESNYKIADPDSPTNEEPIGLPVAHIKQVPSISINTHLFWQKRKITVNKLINDQVIDSFEIYNLCQLDDISSIELNEWANLFYSKHIDTEKLIVRYLNYQSYSVSFDNGFIGQFKEWRDEDFDSLKYLLLLMKDIEVHPFSGGMGQTENLLNRGKEASKRINITDRLSYVVEKNNVHLISCKGHYDFH
ncbi:MAG: type II toxin-antitoxin system YoeB family toxin [Bacteroidetes bacterium]|nr:type II toxin-antitoxin system YoeB family toxin [Bacteroidota bacterium]